MAPPSSLLIGDIVSKGKKLRPTATVVRGRDGRVRVERKDLLSSAEADAKIAASVNAGKLRGEAARDQKEHAAKLLGDTSGDRIFPVRDGEVHEFYPSAGEDVVGGVGGVAGQPRRDNHGGGGGGEWNLATTNNNNPETPSPPSSSSFFFRGSRSINVATYNIWFDDYQWKRRTEALIDLLVNVELIDVVCLQEVTPGAFRKILRNPIVRREYYASDDAGCKTLGSYGVAMLFRRTLTVPKLEWLPLPTRMGRSALVASWSGGGNDDGGLAIATVHLESLNSREIRTKQLGLIRCHLKKHATAFLVGDYNITATGPYGDRDEHDELYQRTMEGFEDAWIAEHGTDADNEGTPGFAGGVTFSSVSNPMVASRRRRGRRRRPPEEARLDRVLVRSSLWGGGGGPSTRNIRIVGNKAIGSDVCISDHFGLAFAITTTAGPR